MSAHNLLASAAKAGVLLVLDDARKLVALPVGAKPAPGLMADLRANKAALAGLLSIQHEWWTLLMADDREIPVCCTPPADQACVLRRNPDAVAAIPMERPAQRPIMTPRGWLAAVAIELDCSGAYLLESGYLTLDDPEEQCGSDPKLAAGLIRSNPAWAGQAGCRYPTTEDSGTALLLDLSPGELAKRQRAQHEAREHKA